MTTQVRRIDGLVDAAVSIFAAWTVAYHIALVLRLDRIVAAGMFVGFVVLLVAFRSRLREAGDDPESIRTGSVGVVVPVALAAAASLAAVAAQPALMWVFATATATAALVWAVRGRRAPEPRRRARSTLEVLGVLILAGGMAILTLIARSPSGDNTYYVNRALYVSEDAGAFPVRDTVFSDQAFPSVAPADTIASIEPLIGTIAAYLPFDVRSLYFLALPALVVALGVLAMWRLTRSGLATSPLLATAGAVIFLLLQSEQSGWGSVVVRRPFWGKAMLIVLAVPWLWHHASTFARTGSRRSLVLASFGAIAAIGFSSSGTFISAIVVAAAMASLIIAPPSGMSRAAGIRRALVGSTAALYPVLAGAAGSLAMRNLGIEYPFRNHDALAVWKEVVGVGPELVVITVIALVGWLAFRAQRLRLGVASAVLGVLVLYSPPGLDAITFLGAGSIGARLMWAIPVPVMAGLAVDAAVRMRPGLRAPAVAAALIVLVVSLAGGGRLILPNRGDAVFTRPQWDYDPGALLAARKLIDLAGAEGVVAAPDRVSQIVPNLSVTVFAASPRVGYTRNLGVVAGPRFHRRERLVVYEGVEGRDEIDADAFTAALATLDVEVACISRRADREVPLLLRDAGWSAAGADRLCSYWQR